MAVTLLGLLTILGGGLYFTVQLGRQRNAAMKNEAEARRQEGEVKKQKDTADSQRKRAEDREGEARRQLDQAQRARC